MLLHLIGLVLFVACHGVSMFVAFRIRSQREPRAIAAAMEASSMAIGPMYLGMLLLIIGGRRARRPAPTSGSSRGSSPRRSCFVLVIGAMYGIATPYYIRVRQAVGAPVRGEPGGEPTASPDELAALLDTRRPEALLVTGGLGLVILLWLMVLKPG